MSKNLYVLGVENLSAAAKALLDDFIAEAKKDATLNVEIGQDPKPHRA